MRINFNQDYGLARQGAVSVAAATIGAGVLSAGAGIWSSSNASNAQQNAGANAIAAQRDMLSQSLRHLHEMFNAGIIRGREVVDPIIGAGMSALPRLNNWLDPNNQALPLGRLGMLTDPNNPDSPLTQLKAMLSTRDSNSPLSKLLSFTDPTQTEGVLADLFKLTRPGADMTTTLEQTPGYKFTEEMGQKAVRNSLAARGLAGPGGALGRGLADYTTGLAKTTWKDVVAALQGAYSTAATSATNALGTGANALNNTVLSNAGVLQNMFNGGASALQNLFGSGASAGSSFGNTVAGGAFGAGNSGANLTQNTGTNIGNNMVGIGNAQAGGYTGIGNAIGGLGNSFTNYAMLSRLFGGGGGTGLYGEPGGPVGYPTGAG